MDPVQHALMLAAGDLPGVHEVTEAEVPAPATGFLVKLDNGSSYRVQLVLTPAPASPPET